jgi:hypothetical protein
MISLARFSRINIGMNEITLANAGPAENKWIVEFSEFRVRNEDQRRAIESLDRRTLFGVLKIWLESITPGARVVEQRGMSTLTISFPTRAASRHFTAWGGKSKPKLSS